MKLVQKHLNPVNMDVVMDAVNRQLLPHDRFLLFAKKTLKNNWVLLTKPDESTEEIIKKYESEIV